MIVEKRMRNEWFIRIGAGRLPLAERGMLATLEALGDEVSMRREELEALFGGEGWLAMAQELAVRGYIELKYDEPFYALRMRYPDARRRRYRKEWTKRKKKEVKR